MDVTKLRSAYAEKMAEAKGLADQWRGKEAEMPQTDADKLAGVLGQADELKARLDLAQRMAEGEAFLSEPGEPKVANVDWRKAGPEEGEAAIDAKAWREVQIETPLGRKAMRYHIPLAVQKKGYGGAFENYLRKGFSELGSTDRKTLSEGVDSAGGFLVPEDFHAELLKKLATQAVIRSLARVVTTSRDLAKWPKVNYTTDDKYTSGVRLTWTGEIPASSTVHRVTDPVFGQIAIPVHTAMASMPITNDMIEDAAFDVLGTASDLLAEAYALGEDDVFITGNGVAKPMGILAQVGTDGPAAIKSGTDGALTTSGDAHEGKRIYDLFYGLPSQYRRRAAWVMNSGTLKAVENLVDTNDRPLVGSLTNISLAVGQPDVMRGRPIYVDEFMPDIAADAYPIIFGDLSGYIVLDRVGFSVQRLSELYAETNLTLLLARRRVGGYLAEPYRVKVMQTGD